MSSNPLMMVTKVETYTSWLALPVAGCWVTAQGCVYRLCGDLNTARRLSFSDECALEVSCTWNALYKSTSLPFLHFRRLDMEQ